jgi:tyrosyl-DNA phosphodiesterase 2
MRDAEVTAIGGLPKGFSDLWEATGARNEAKFTWDLTRNTNLTWNQKFKPRCRFDRMFFRENRNSNQELTLMPVYFELEGLEKLKTCNRFCSDHWAIQVYCQIEKM